ncbi:MAG: SH3 domain-containing protein [Campylobacterales bacterium]
MRYRWLVGAIVVALTGCVSPEPALPMHNPPVQQATITPPSTSIPLPSQPSESLEGSCELPTPTYHQSRFFAAWEMTPAQFLKDEAMWPWRTFKAGRGYGLNKRLLPPQWFEKLKKNAQMERFPSRRQPALTLRRTDLRAFPTYEPYFLDPNRAGEGFPFDYLQVSAIHPGEAVMIAHESIDGAWAYIYTSYAEGWVLQSDLVAVDDEVMAACRALPQAVLLQDRISLRDDKGRFRIYADLGTILPILRLENQKIELLLPLIDADSSFMATTVTLPLEQAAPIPLPYTAANKEKIIKALAGQTYGWGGIGGLRDCSATLRDYFAPFGVWLPRNSGAQAKIGRHVSLKDLNDNEKEARIASEAIPFETLITFKGHVALFVGVDEHNRSMIFHNVWGLRSFTGTKEERKIIGQAVITTLWENGEIIGDPDPNVIPFIRRVTGMTFLSDKLRASGALHPVRTATESAHTDNKPSS